MKTYLLNVWDRLSGSYWFVPAACVTIAICIALIVPDYEMHVLSSDFPYPEWVKTTVAASRTTLSVIFTALLGITGTVFSITMVVLSLTSQQYGPRLLRGFMQDRSTQVTLGAFLATTMYALLLLRRLEVVDSGAQFSLHFSVLLAVVMTLLCIALLIYYINHIAVMIQAPEVIQNVTREAYAAVDRLYPADSQKIAGDTSPVGEDQHEHEYTRDLPSTGTGYVQAIDIEGLIRFASDQGTHLRLFIKPGDYVHEGQKIAALYRDHGDKDTDNLIVKLNSHFILGPRRTPRQDLGCALLELVEIAVRALSPGINDPHTPMNCIDSISSVLMRLAKRDFPERCRRDKDGTLRLITERLDFKDYLSLSFTKIRECASFHSSIYSSILRAFVDLEEVARDKENYVIELKHQRDLTLLLAKNELKEGSSYSQLEGLS